MKFFIHRLDTYLGRILCRTILNTPVVRAGDEDAPQPAVALKHTICGTLADPQASLEYVQQHITKEIVSMQHDLDAYKSALLSSNVIIFDLVGSPEDTSYAFKLVNTHSFPDQKIFLCLSSLMTWYATYPKKEEKKREAGEEGGDADTGTQEGEAAEEEEEEPERELLTEDLYHRRKAHPLYAKHKEVEKLVSGGVKNPRLLSYVVFSGLAYGEGEDLLHDMFRQAWLLKPEALAVYGKGKNLVPMVHVVDLARCVTRLALCPAESRPEQRYITAVDTAQSTLKEVVEALAKELGSGKTYHMPQDEVLLVEQSEQFTVDLRMECGLMKDLEGFEWHCESGFVENLPSIVKEYKAVRRLEPVRIVVFGPPASGKSVWSKHLGKFYKVPVISAAETVAKYRLANPPETSEEDGEDGDDAGKKQDGGEPKPLPRMDDVELTKAFRWRLLQPDCRNHGFILDGFPKTYAQARLLFTQVESADDIAPLGDDVDSNERCEVDKEKLMPELVVTFTLSDQSVEVLKDRLKAQPAVPNEKGELPDEEARFERRLAEYKKANTVTVSPVHFMDVHQVRILSFDAHATHELVLQQMTDHVGEPRNYGLTPEELAEEEAQRRAEEQERQRQAEEEEKARQMRVRREQEEQRAREEAERKRIEEIKAQERAVLEERSKPLRKYLMEAVVPTLTQGLMEVCKLRPEDPIDFLAEYLFRHNPVEDEL